MPWIPEEHMADVHIIRQDYARAYAYLGDHPEEAGALADFEEVDERRARAIRMIHDEDNASIKHLSAMFRCSKTAVRTALAGEPE